MNYPIPQRMKRCCLVKIGTPCQAWSNSSLYCGWINFLGFLRLASGQLYFNVGATLWLPHALHYLRLFDASDGVVRTTFCPVCAVSEAMLVIFPEIFLLCVWLPRIIPSMIHVACVWLFFFFFKFFMCRVHEERHMLSKDVVIMKGVRHKNILPLLE